jgi:uncharacterized protein (TIGR02391 family)
VSRDDGLQLAISVGQRIGSDLAGLGVAGKPAPASLAEAADAESPEPGDKLLAEYDRRMIRNPELRAATRSRFQSGHYADAVEAGVKALNEYIRSRTGRTEDGDGLMTLAFSPARPLLRINKLRSKADESAQRGHMQLCQGVVAAWRNPRAHALTDDDPVRCLMMLETISDLIETTNQAVRTRRHGKP